MIRVALLTILSLGYALPSGAQVTSDLPGAFKRLNVKLAASCPLVEKAPHSPQGVHLPTTLCRSSNFTTATKMQAKVYRVVDGDTIHVYVGSVLYSTRMLGMDTPELHYMGRAQPVWAERARASLASMVRPGDTVTLEFDKQKCDRYGRLLVHIYRGGMNLNYEQIRRGMSANYCISPNLKYCAQYGDAYASAKSRRIGFHRDACAVTPYVWRKGLEGKPMDKPLKDRRSGNAVPASDYYKIPVADRVFYPAQAKI